MHRKEGLWRQEKGIYHSPELCKRRPPLEFPKCLGKMSSIVHMVSLLSKSDCCPKNNVHMSGGPCVCSEIKNCHREPEPWLCIEDSHLTLQPSNCLSSLRWMPLAFGSPHHDSLFRDAHGVLSISLHPSLLPMVSCGCTIPLQDSFPKQLHRLWRSSVC